VINLEQDSACLQCELNAIINWTEKWQMQLNTDKCVVLRCTKSLCPVEFNYKLKDTIPKLTQQHWYLGITFHESMNWSHHIKITCSKTTKSLNFIRRNSSRCHSDVKINAYFTIVRPILEYAASDWDSFYEYLISDIEEIQRHATRWVFSDYSYYSSVTDILTFLEWPMLQNRRRIDRLSQLHKIIHHHTPAIELPSYFLPTQYSTRQMHQNHFIIPVSSTLLYQKSFFHIL